MSTRCIHCLGPVEPPAEVCEECIDLLSDLDEPEPEPARRVGPFEPSPEDMAAYREMSARGAFRTFSPPRAIPRHATNRWGKAVKNMPR